MSTMKKRVLCSALFLLIALLLPGQRTLHDLEGSWAGFLKIPAGNLNMVLHFTMSEADTLIATVDSPDQSAMGIPCGRVTLAGDSVSVDIPIVQGHYGALFSSDTLLTGTWSQLGGRYELSLIRGARPVEYARPQLPQPPFPYSEEEVTFTNKVENFTLAGTLTLPPGPGPFPAVVLISGSGQQDRDETIFMHKPFLVLADHLARHGIAVLRYDDRGVGGSGGKYTHATSLTFADDTEAAVEYLLQRPETDRLKTGLMGHSEGGLIAPIVASRRSDIAFIVSLAGPGVKGGELMLKQAADMLTANGTPEEEVDETIRINSTLFTMVTKTPDQRTFAREAMAWYSRELETQGLTPEEIKEKMSVFTQGVVTLNNDWMRYFIATDPAQFWSAARCPVLALNGMKDLQVNYEMNLPAIKRAARKGGNRKVKTVALPELNHLFQRAETGSTMEYATIEETFSPVALDLISSWIRKTLKIR